LSVTLITQHEKRMCLIILSSVVCLSVPYFPTLSHKRRDFQETIFELKMRVLIFSTTFLILRITARDIIIVPRSSCKVRVVIFRS